jgi:hypothetical protein
MMNTKAIFTIVAIVAAIGMLGMAAVAVPSVHQAYADKGNPGVPNGGVGNPNHVKNPCTHPNQGEPCNPGK